MDDTAAETSLVLGSASSSETPRWSTRTRRGRTPAELQAHATALLASPKVTEKTASKPPAPGTPASRTPSIFIVASSSCLCDSGSIYKIRAKGQTRLNNNIDTIVYTNIDIPVVIHVAVIMLNITPKILLRTCYTTTLALS